jgi:cAMP phosphodiesterase
LTPNYLLKELRSLSELTGENALKGFKIIITHMKPPTENFVKIKAQLKKQNDLHLEFIFPAQGERFQL